MRHMRRVSGQAGCGVWVGTHACRQHGTAQQWRSSRPLQDVPGAGSGHKLCTDCVGKGGAGHARQQRRCPGPQQRQASLGGAPAWNITPYHSTVQHGTATLPRQAHQCTAVVEVAQNRFPHSSLPCCSFDKSRMDKPEPCSMVTQGSGAHKRQRHTTAGAATLRLPRTLLMRDAWPTQ